jgi:hypothetical protein
LQIAHRCWRDAGGELDGVDDAAVLRAARDGGTLTERAKLAVADIDRVFERMGLTGREFRLPDGTLVERLGTAAGGAQAVAVVLARATDPIQEVTTAQTMTRIREVLASVPSKPLLLVVPIGYRSDSVQRLIENISWVVPFDGTDFEARLQGSLNQMTVVPPPLAGGESAPLLDSVLQRLERLQTSLEELRIIRQDRAEATAVRLAEGTEKLAAPEREQREARTKWELVDGLEGVRSALDEGGREQERALVRSLLVANEVYVQNSAFDYLGGLYMDVLDLESSLERSARARGFPPGGETMAVQIRNLRAEIIRLARRSVMQRREPVAMLRLAAAAVAAVAGAAFAYFILLRQETGWLLTRGEGAAITAGFAAGAAALGGLAWWYVDTYRRSPQASYSGVAREFDTLRFKVTSWGGTPDHTRA